MRKAIAVAIAAILLSVAAPAALAGDVGPNGDWLELLGDVAPNGD